jgi:hypothetical protein
MSKYAIWGINMNTFKNFPIFFFVAFLALIGRRVQYGGRKSLHSRERSKNIRVRRLSWCPCWRVEPRRGNSGGKKSCFFLWFDFFGSYGAPGTIRGERVFTRGSDTKISNFQNTVQIHTYLLVARSPA